MSKTKVIAIDLGASSGRLVEVVFHADRLAWNEKYRFLNSGVAVNGRFYTDILYIFNSIIKGLQICAKEEEEGYESVGIDSWGVDFGFLDQEGELLINPYHYRDSQSGGMMEVMSESLGDRGLFFETGCQNMWYNTVYQLKGLEQRKKGVLENAHMLLMIPDILGYFLTGKCSLEYTSVSTTQMYDMKNKTWSEKILSVLGLDKKLFPEILETGSIKGEFREDVKRMTGLIKGNVKLIAAAQHDSASAAYAVPADEPEYLFINSGTWSIIGTVVDEPVISNEVFEKGFSNEGAAFGKIKLVKSVMGMWQVQEIRKHWEKAGYETGYGYLINEAKKAAPFSGFIDADDEIFIAPDNMEAAISQYLEKTRQAELFGQGAFYRVIMESLAFKYKQAILDLEGITGRVFEKLYLLGGAVQDVEFCQYIANATGKEVIAGPVEATAIGNAVIQLRALGRIKEEQVTGVIKNSFPVQRSQPEDIEVWDSSYAKYLQFTK